MRRTIPYVPLAQNGYQLYCFTLSAKEFIDHGVVRRLSGSKDPAAIQRDVIRNHVADMANAMMDTGVLWPEAVIVSLAQRPDIKEGCMVLPDDYWFYVDDGQHRYYSLKTLEQVNKKLPDLQFVVIATHGLSVAERIRVFKLQANRQKISRDFTLALSAKSGEFKNEAQRRAYAVIMRLANDERSPLRGHISSQGDFRARNSECWLSPSSLLSLLERMFAKKGAWYELKEEQVVDAFKAYLGELRGMWGREWDDSDRKSLRTNSSITALIACFATNPRTTPLLSSYTDANEVRRFARLLSGFNWDKQIRGTQTWRQIGKDLEYFMLRAAAKANP